MCLYRKSFSHTTAGGGKMKRIKSPLIFSIYSSIILCLIITIIAIVGNDKKISENKDIQSVIIREEVVNNNDYSDTLDISK